MTTRDADARRRITEDLDSTLFVEAGAGTGKTLIATEAARRIGALGKKTLFLCFNRLLADQLARAPDIDHGVVSIRSLHRFMRDEIVAAGLEHEMAERQRQAANQNEYFSKSMPELFGYTHQWVNAGQKTHI